jgi:uncharacterized protein
VIRSPVRPLALVLFAGLALAARDARAEIAVPAAPTRWVTDSAGFLSEGAREELDGRLQAYQRQSGHQVLVWIGRTTGVVPLEDFTVRAFAAWKVGRKGLDDGVILFVLSDDRKIRIEVGYGLEGEVPDAIASRIIREAIVPRVQAGDRDGAIRAGVAALIAAVEGEAASTETTAGPPPGRSPPSGPRPPMSMGQKIVIGLAVIGFLILLVTNPSLALYLLFSLMSGGRGGGGGGGGGGFSGGGGRSGGGGASGSW